MHNTQEEESVWKVTPFSLFRFLLLLLSCGLIRCSLCLMLSPSSSKSESQDTCDLRKGFCPLECQVPDTGHLGSFRNYFSFLGFLKCSLAHYQLPKHDSVFCRLSYSQKKCLHFSSVFFHKMEQIVSQKPCAFSFSQNHLTPQLKTAPANSSSTNLEVYILM